VKGKIIVSDYEYIDDEHCPIPKYVIKYYDSKGIITPLFVYKEDIDEFMDDIMSGWMKLKGIDVWRFENKKVITKKEEVEQDKDEQEMDSDYKTYDNLFPSDEAIDYDVKVRERV